MPHWLLVFPAGLAFESLRGEAGAEQNGEVPATAFGVQGCFLVRAVGRRHTSGACGNLWYAGCAARLFRQLHFTERLPALLHAHSRRRLNVQDGMLGSIQCGQAANAGHGSGSTAGQPATLAARQARTEIAAATAIRSADPSSRTSD